MNSASDDTIQCDAGLDADVELDASESDDQTIDSETVAQPSRRTKVFAKIGIVLILSSGVFFFLMLSVPWWPISGTNKALVAGGLLIGVEVAWWVGAACAGPATVGAIRRWFVRS